MKDKDVVNHMKDKKAEEFSVEHLANALGVAVRTIKNWEKSKLIPNARRNNFNWRIYTQTEIDGIVETVKKNGFFINNRSLATSNPK